MSKRLLLQLVNEKRVSGWDDPRMPTLSGMRRRGYTPEAIRNFIGRIGYTKVEAINDIGLLEYAVREDLNQHTPRVFRSS
jgi:glutaminyl-tRNA synthetase